jgi:hypothetical protein
MATIGSPIYVHDARFRFSTGLPDFSWCNVPKRDFFFFVFVAILPKTGKIPNDYNIYKVATKYTKMAVK